MGICGPRGCGCAIQSESLEISGSGAPGDPWLIESNGITTVTSVTRPGTPFLGQVIFETDTQRTYLWNGSAWKIQHDPQPDAWVTSGFGGNTDSTDSNTVWSTWFDPGLDPVAPPWVTAGRIDAVLTLVSTDIAGDLFIGMRCVLDGIAGAQRIYKIPDGQSPSFPYQDKITGLTSDGVTPMTLTVEAKRVFAGASKARVGSLSQFTAQIRWSES